MKRAESASGDIAALSVSFLKQYDCEFLLILFEMMWFYSHHAQLSYRMCISCLSCDSSGSLSEILFFRMHAVRAGECLVL